MSTDLVDFLRARLYEDERSSREAVDDGLTYGVWWGDNPVDELIQIGINEGCSEKAANHLRRHSPARVLAEVEAKRKIITGYEGLLETQQHPKSAIGIDVNYGSQLAVEDVLRLLASVYDDHPDYREEWRS